MSEKIETTETDPTPKADRVEPREDATAAALRSLAAERDQALAEVKTREKRIVELTGERDAFKGQVENFDRKAREGALLERIEKAYPGAERMALRGVVAVLGESGKLDRHPAPEVLDEVAKKAIELIKTEAPSLTRTLGPVGGASGVPLKPQQPRSKSLVWG